MGCGEGYRETVGGAAEERTGVAKMRGDEAGGLMWMPVRFIGC